MSTEIVKLDLQRAGITVHPYYQELLPGAAPPTSMLQPFARALESLYMMRPILLLEHRAAKKTASYILIGGLITYWTAIACKAKTISAVIIRTASEEEEKEMVLVDYLLQPMAHRVMFQPRELVAIYDIALRKDPAILKRYTGEITKDKIWPYTGASKSKGQAIRKEMKGPVPEPKGELGNELKNPASTPNSETEDENKRISD